jgi:hypothetical protein
MSQEIPEEYVEDAKEEVQRWDDDRDAVQNLAELLYRTNQAMEMHRLDTLATVMHIQEGSDIYVNDMGTFLRWAKDQDDIDVNAEELIEILMDFYEPDETIAAVVIDNHLNAYKQYKEEGGLE